MFPSSRYISRILYQNVLLFLSLRLFPEFPKTPGRVSSVTRKGKLPWQKSFWCFCLILHQLEKLLILNFGDFCLQLKKQTIVPLDCISLGRLTSRPILQYSDPSSIIFGTSTLGISGTAHTAPDKQPRWYFLLPYMYKNIVKNNLIISSFVIGKIDSSVRYYV